MTTFAGRDLREPAPEEESPGAGTGNDQKLTSSARRSMRACRKFCGCPSVEP
jgi:hypothetical protein